MYTCYYYRSFDDFLHNYFTIIQTLFALVFWYLHNYSNSCKLKSKTTKQQVRHILYIYIYIYIYINIKIYYIYF